MKLIERNFDVLDNLSELELLQTIKSFPVYMGTVTSDYKKDLKADMSWFISKKTGMIQLNKLIPLNILYQQSHDSGVVGKVWEKHHSKFCQFIEKYDHKKIIEIGGANGILANKFHKNNQNINWVIIDPNSKPLKNCKAKFINKFYDEKLDLDYKDSTIVHSHTLEHVYNPLKFMSVISKKINNNRLIFSVPNIKEMVRRKYTNAINFEHTYFLTEEFTKYYLDLFGFEIEFKEYFLEDHSIFYSAFKKYKKVKKEIKIKNYYKENKKIFNEYKEYNDRIVNKLNDQIESSKGNVYLFGAHIFSQHLLSIGLSEKNITSILDNDITKQSRRLYGTTLHVNSPKILRNQKSPTVILKAGAYNSEIKKDILENINSKTIFL